MDFEALIESGNNYKPYDVIVACRAAIKKDLEDPNLRKIKEDEPIVYENTMSQKYPNFSDRFPWLFDKLISDPYNLPHLDYMLQQVKSTNERNLENKTQEVADYLATQKLKN